MKPVNSWYQIIKFAICSLIVYLFIGYLLLAAYLLHYEINIFTGAGSTLYVSTNNNATSSLSARVHNVFGDPIPHVVAFIDGRIVQADATGFFSIDKLVPGRYTLELFAGEYQPYRWDILIEDGTNNPSIKYDTGLWPQYFLPDFHVFHNNSGLLFGLIGFANGSDQPIYVHQARIYDPNGEQIFDLFSDPDMVEYYQILSTKIDVVTEPQTALRISSRTWVLGEIPPTLSNLTEGMYRLQIHYGAEKHHQTGLYQLHSIADQLEPNPNLNPHLP